MSLNPLIRGLRLAFIIIFTAFDVGQAIYKVREMNADSGEWMFHWRFVTQVYFLEEAATTSYAGHAFGALAGLLIGVFLLENRKVEDWERIFEWIFLILYAVLLLVLVAWHIVGTQTGWFPEQRFP